MLPLSNLKRPPLLAASVAFLVGCQNSPQELVARGDRFFDSGKLDDAAIQYRRAIQKSPDTGEAYYRLALVELRQDHLVQAYPLLKEASNMMAADSDVTAKLGQVALTLYAADQGHSKQFYDQATLAATQLLTRDSGDFNGNRLRGALALIDARPQDAVEYFRRAVARKPADRGAQLDVARALAQDNEISGAVQIARQIVQTNSDFGPAYDFLFAQYRASGSAKEAEDILRQKVGNNPRRAEYIVELAGYYAAQSRPGDVAATIGKLLADPAAFPEGRLQAGDFYLSISQPDEALRYYGEGLKAEPQNQSVWRVRIYKVLALQQKWPEALAEMDLVLKANPADHETRLAQAMAWLSEGRAENLDAAIAELRDQLAVRHPHDPVLRFQLGGALLRKGDRDGARREWSTDVQDNAGYLPPRMALIQLSLDRGDSREALRLAEDMIAVAGRNLEARLTYASCLTAAGQYQAARAELRRLDGEFPHSPEVAYRMGMLALSEKHFIDAEKIFVGLRSSGKDASDIAAGLARVYEGENDPARAIKVLQDELARAPQAAELRQLLAGIAFSAGKYDIAIEQYRHLVVSSPDPTEIQLQLASAYIASRDPKSAIAILEKIPRSEPKSTVASLQMAQALAAVKRVDEAKARYRRILETDPNNANALNDLAFLMADSGEDLSGALALAQRAGQFAAEPALKASVTDTLGWIYLKKQMYDAAVQTLEPLVRANPRNPTYLYHLGSAYYAKGDLEAARTELNAGLALKPPDDDAQAMRALLAHP
ncbi:MAG TPA: tetratricopeptide repeat protein [Bryobacteraceae bacterium]|nr:tetratricopeptide repeat protein [Bryobacteraceae bacterium]